MNKIFDEIRANCREHIKTCDLIIDRMVDQWCIALPEDGHVLTKEGITQFPVAFGETVLRDRNKAKVQATLDNIKRDNPDNASAQRLQLMSLKKSARLQREVSLKLIEKIDAMEAKEAS